MNEFQRVQIPDVCLRDDKFCRNSIGTQPLFLGGRSLYLPTAIFGRKHKEESPTRAKRLKPPPAFIATAPSEANVNVHPILSGSLRVNNADTGRRYLRGRT